MINFISYNNRNKQLVIFQCESLIDMCLREEIGDTVIHKTGKDITGIVNGFREELKPIKWDIEVFEQAVKQYPNKQLDRCEDCGNYITYKGAFIHCDCDRSTKQFNQTI